VCIGPAASKESYLNIPRLIAAAEVTNADSIHPGYGFLSENANFAEICASSGIIFIGPSRKQSPLWEIRPLQKKPWSGRRTGRTRQRRVFPISPKQKKMRLKSVFLLSLKRRQRSGGDAHRCSEDELENAFFTASHEAETAFGNRAVYIENILRTRHIEIQIMGTEQEQSPFRRKRLQYPTAHQKLWKNLFSGSFFWLREAMGTAAIKGQKCKIYRSGTIEFLLDKNKNFYFMEMNTRIQVEHPSRKKSMGRPCKMQLQVVAGERLKRQRIKPLWHAMNAASMQKIRRRFPSITRTYYEPPFPAFRRPGGFACVCGYYISPYYDSLIAKLIVKGKNREEAISRMHRRSMNSLSRHQNNHSVS